MRTWTTIVIAAVGIGCGQDPVDGGGDPDGVTDTDDTTDTDFPPPVATGPNPETSGGAETCVLLYGGGDRIRGGDLWLPDTTEPREIQVWVRTRSLKEQVAFSYGRPSSQQGMLLGTTVGGFPMIRAGMGTDQVLGAHSIADDKWHHLVATWDGAQGALVVDGEVDGYGTLQADTLEGDAVAGNAPTGDLTVPWIGWVDDVRVFAGHREPEEIAADPEGELLPDDALKLWWDFEVGTDGEGGPGVVVPDLSGYGHDGVSSGTTDTPEFPACR